MGVDVGGVDEGGFFGGVQGAQKIGDIFREVLGVFAVEEGGVCEPAFVEVPGALGGDEVGGGVCAGDLVAAICFEGDAAVWHEFFADVVGF